MKLPKLNEEIVVVRKDLLLEVYDVKTRERVRQLLLVKEEEFFDAERQEADDDCNEHEREEQDRKQAAVARRSTRSLFSEGARISSINVGFLDPSRGSRHPEPNRPRRSSFLKQLRQAPITAPAIQEEVREQATDSDSDETVKSYLAQNADQELKAFEISP